MTTLAPVPVIAFGLGPIGRRIAAAVIGEPRLRLVGAVDVDPQLAGRPLTELVDGAPAVTIAASLAAALPDPIPAELTVLHATGSFLDQVAPQLVPLLDAGVHVVSTCEELAYPWVREPALARDLDAAARARQRTLVATGVNPGLLMDQLPVTLTGASHTIRAVRVIRRQDPSSRRLPFQRKVGMNIPRAEWDRRNAAGGFGHVGLIESGRLLAAGLGWAITDWHDSLAPVQPDPEELVLGVRQTLSGRDPEGRTIELLFEAHSGVSEDLDEIVVDGTPPLRMQFVGGVAGDEATAAAVLRAARVIPSAPRGLITVLDLPLRARPAPG
jgi:hypothetical protein